MRKPRSPGQGSVHYTEIVDAYRTAFGMSVFDYIIALITGRFKLDNENYDYIDEEGETLIQMILDADMGDREDWIEDSYDCGAFTFNLMGVFHQNKITAAMPIFILWVNTSEGGHAVISYYKDCEVKIIEPQNDDIYALPEEWKLMLLCG